MRTWILNISICIFLVNQFLLPSFYNMNPNSDFMAFCKMNWHLKTNGRGLFKSKDSLTSIMPQMNVLHGGEFGQNVVHWRREWLTTSVFLPREHREQYEKAKRQDTERWTPQVSRRSNMLLEMSGEITPERMKGWSQSKNNTQLYMRLVIEARFDAVKSNIA